MNDSFSLDQKPAVLSFEPKRAAAESWRWVREHGAVLLSTIFIAAMCFNMLTVITRKSITIDESAMIPAAYYHLAVGNFQLIQDHPPLSKILAGIPLLFIQPEELNPAEVGAPPYTPEAEFAYQSRFWRDNIVRTDSISFWSRVPMIALTGALGFLIFLFTRELFNSRAAVFAVALFAFEPTVLAHGRVVQTDIPAAFGLLFVCFALHRYLQTRSWRNSALLGFACGVALLTKFSTLLIAPVLLVVMIVLLWRMPSERRLLLVHAAVVIVIPILIIEGAYYFDNRPLTSPDLLWIASAFPNRSVLVEKSIRVLSSFLPTDFVLGAFWQVWHSDSGHQAGLLGMYEKKGWWYYFPVAFALKTSLPFLFISLASVAWATVEAVRTRSRSLLFCLIPFVIYTLFVMFSTINIGVRYYLPAYGFLFMLSGAFLDRLLRIRSRQSLATILVVVLVGWCVVEAVRTYPDYVPYMNQLAFSHPHWWYLSDSNVEWGDDIKALAGYLHARGETRIQSAALAGFVLPAYGIENIDLIAPNTSSPPSTRYIAIGASFLNGSTVPARAIDGTDMSEDKRINRFAAYRDRTPEAVFGKSIYLYRMQP